MLLLMPALLGGCVGFAGHRMANTLSGAIVNEDDPELVRDGAPAYLLMVDGLIRDNPDDQGLLIGAARLDTLYATVFVDQPPRVLRLTDKALAYGRRALCLRIDAFCGDTLAYDAFTAALKEVDEDDLPALYAYALSWSGWLRARSNDPMALAALPKVTAMLERVVALNPDYENGQPHLFLGILASQLSPALGGRPEEGKAHFEEAVNLSGGHDLLAKVEYARNYAKVTFDRALYERLLNEVLAADPMVPGYTLMNVLAQRQARALLKEADDYFGD
jgi:hypothetical protein